MTLANYGVEELDLATAGQINGGEEDKPLVKLALWVIDNWADLKEGFVDGVRGNYSPSK